MAYGEKKMSHGKNILWGKKLDAAPISVPENLTGAAFGVTIK